jgi:ATP-dependent Lon protease
MVKNHEWLDREVPPTLPVLLLKSTVLFPLQVASVQIAMKPNQRLLSEHADSDEIVAAGVFMDPDGPYKRSNLCSTAVACRVLSRIKMDRGTTQVALQGLRRVTIRKLITTRPYFKAEVEPSGRPGKDGPRVRDLITQVIGLIKNLVQVDPRYGEEMTKVAQLNVESGSRCADLVADMVHFGYAEKREVLAAIDVSERLTLLVELLGREIARAQVAKELHAKTELSLDRGQREAFLREQLVVIRDELDEFDPVELEIAKLNKRVDSGNLPPLVAEEARREVQRLRDDGTRSHGSIRAYVDWVLSMPWHEVSKDRYDLRRAKRILDNRYFGLGNARDRLMEFMAVRKLGGNSRKPLLGIMGPPGTGRTSLASTVAQILGRRFVRISMNGIHDESEIRGQRRTNSAASPGRILDALRRAETRNPVILLDEIDRLEAGVGDPMLAILEALDPARNCHFFDHYLGVPYDLSEVLFIITANVEEEMPLALFDFMHTLSLSGYTEGVKMAIARERIWPRAAEDHGLSVRDVRLTNAALRTVIRRYTREAGVHELGLQLEAICRRVSVQMATRGRHRVSVNSKNLEKYLGKPVYAEGPGDDEPEVGTAIGLAWTETGGNLLPVEALLMPGEGTTLLTGLLGEVMQESVRTALSCVRSRAEELHIPPDALTGKDLHVHFPEAAIPKDGPSAGVVVATTIASLLSGRPVRRDVAMTGEISLRGWVYPVGGTREKVLAAFRAGITQVILPRGNESDLVDVPRDVLSKMQVHFVTEVSEVFRIALVKRRKNARSR